MNGGRRITRVALGAALRFCDHGTGFGTGQNTAAAAVFGAAGHEEPATAATNPNFDAAYGAYQRGLYLTALADASQRAQQGDPAAMTLLGELYAHGSGIGRDDEKAKQWYQAAAARGDRDAMFALAMFNFAGRGGPRNEQEGTRLLSEAAKLGHAAAAYDLGLIYMQGQMFPQDLSRAAELFRAAADAGSTDAQYALGTMYQGRQRRTEKLDRSDAFDEPGLGRRQCRRHGRIRHRAIQRRRCAEERSGSRRTVFEGGAPRQSDCPGSPGAHPDGGPRHGRPIGPKRSNGTSSPKPAATAIPSSTRSPPSKARRCAPRPRRRRSFGSRPRALRRWRRAPCPAGGATLARATRRQAISVKRRRAGCGLPRKYAKRAPLIAPLAAPKATQCTIPLCST